MNLKLAGILAGLALGGVAFAQMNPDQRNDEQRDEMKPDKEHMQPGAQHDLIEGMRHDVTARVLGVSGKTLFIEKDGLAVPLEVNDQTAIEGNMVKGRQIESQLRNTFREGDQVRASFEVKKARGDKLENQALKLDKGMMKLEKKTK